MRILVVATFRNEGCSLLEWVAHHRRIGVTDFVIYQNDSQDTTVAQLRLLHQMGVITYVDNTSDADSSPQFRAYRRASRLPVYQEVDWAMTLDGDEFIQIHGGDGTLPDAIRRIGEDADVISLNWRLFGNSGRARIAEAFLPNVFTQCERSEFIRTEPRYFKSLIKPTSFGQLAIHGPRRPLKGDPVQVNGSGVDFRELRHGPMRCNDPKEREFAQINHYAVRDAASFLHKIARGNAGAANRTRSFDYWRRHNLNDETDMRLADQSDALADAVHELNERSGGRLLTMRRKSIRWARQSVKSLLEDPEMRETMDQIQNLRSNPQ